MASAPRRIDWSALGDAYGTAASVPDDLRALQSTKRSLATVAMDSLWGRLCHQGSVFPASAAAVPDLAAIASSRKAHLRAEVLELLAGIAVGDHTNYLDGALSPARQRGRTARTTATRSVEETCYRSVARHVPRLRALLADSDPRVRGAAAFALAWFRESAAASARAIATQCERERDDHARSSMLMALGHLGASSQRRLLDRAVAETGAGASSGVGAAIGLVYLDGRQATERARAVLEKGWRSRALRRTTQPWNDGNLAGHAAIVLATLPARKSVAEEAIDRLTGVGYLAGDRLGGELVRTMFAGRAPKPARDLTERQRTLLTTLVQTGLLRSQGFVEHWLKLRGLPDVRELPRFIGAVAQRHPEVIAAEKARRKWEAGRG